MKEQGRTMMYLCDLFCWTFTLVALCGTLQSGSAAVVNGNTGISSHQDSLRLLKLKLMSMELGSDIRARRSLSQGLFSTDGRPWSLVETLRSGQGTVSRRHLTQKKSLDSAEDSPSRLQALRRVLRRYRDVSDLTRIETLSSRSEECCAMDNLKQLYSGYYDTLNESVQLLVTRYTALARSQHPEFQYAVDIPKLLPKNDPDFSSNGNVNSLFTKCFLVLDLTNLLYSKIKDFVRDEYKQWVKETGDNLQITSIFMEIALMSLKIDTTTAQRLQIIPSAISGGNQAVQLQSMDPDVLDRLSDLARALQSV